MGLYISLYKTPSSLIKGLHLFQQLVQCPDHKPKPKLQSKDHLVRYLHHRTKHIRIDDFRLSYPAHDPKATTNVQFHTLPNEGLEIDDYHSGDSPAPGPTAAAQMFQCISTVSQAYYVGTARYFNIGKTINPATLPPRNKAEALRYPDAVLDLKDINEELAKFYARGAVD